MTVYCEHESDPAYCPPCRSAAGKVDVAHIAEPTGGGDLYGGGYYPGGRRRGWGFADRVDTTVDDGLDAVGLDGRGWLDEAEEVTL